MLKMRELLDTACMRLKKSLYSAPFTALTMIWFASKVALLSTLRILKNVHVVQYRVAASKGTMGILAVTLI